MKRSIHFTDVDRRRAVVTERPGWFARLFGAKARTASFVRTDKAAWNWAFEIDGKTCPSDLAYELSEARRWELLEGLPGARVVKQ